MNLTDREATRRAAAGDIAAFVLLVDRYRAALIGHLIGLNVPRCEVEDLAQESFCRAWQHLPQIDPSRLVAWLYRTATNLAMSYHRKPKIALLTIDPPRTPDTREDPSVEVHRAIAELSDEHRIVIALRHFSGMSHEAIANQLEIPAGTVRSRLSRAYSRLRPVLAHLREEMV